MSYIPHEKLNIEWINNDASILLSLPWMSMEVDVTQEDKEWITDAVYHLHSSPSQSSVQKFIHKLKDCPLFYIQPRNLEEFNEEDLQACPPLDVNPSSPLAFISTFKCKISDELKRNIFPIWTWEREKILNKARIPRTRFYDPISLMSYLICYRLEWESTTWLGQDGFGQFLERLLKHDEAQFFQAIGWVAKQSWYKAMESGKTMKPSLTHFEKGKELIHQFICDGAEYYKFMEQVFRDISLDKEDFPICAGTKWLLKALERTATISPLAFSGLINLFEASTYCEKQDPISRVFKLSSKPYAAQGFDLHYKSNQEHCHYEMPIKLAACLGPQSQGHALLTLSLFELTLNFLETMEKNITKTFKI